MIFITHRSYVVACHSCLETPKSIYFYYVINHGVACVELKQKQYNLLMKYISIQSYTRARRKKKRRKRVKISIQLAKEKLRGKGKARGMVSSNGRIGGRESLTSQSY